MAAVTYAGAMKPSAEPPAARAGDRRDARGMISDRVAWPAAGRGSRWCREVQASIAPPFAPTPALTVLGRLKPSSPTGACI